MSNPIKPTSIKTASGDTIWIDIASSEEHTLDATVTSYPTEKGSTITDNVLLQPIQLTMECVVSATPIGDIVKERLAEGGDNPPQKVYQQLIELRNSKQPCAIDTSLIVYNYMVPESLSFPRDISVGDALKFRITFKEIRTVTNERTTIRTAKPNGKKKRNLGNKPFIVPVLPGVLGLNITTLSNGLITGSANIPDSQNRNAKRYAQAGPWQVLK
jgi:hypothetical protein